MQAKQLFPNEFPQYARHKKYMAALIVLQRKAWALYSVLLTVDVIWTGSMPRAGTDGAYVYINPDWFFDLPNDSQRAFILAHEIEHVILRHPARSKFYRERGFHSMRGSEKVGFDRDLFNVSEDFVINADLIAHGLEPVPEGCYDDRFGRDELVDAVYLTMYDEMPEEPEDDETGEGEGEGEGESSDESEDGEAGEGEAGESESGEDGDEGTGGNGSGEGEPTDEDQTAEGDGSGEGGDGETTDKSDGKGEGEGTPEPSNHGGHDDHFEPQYDGTPEEQQKAAAEDKAEIQRRVDQALDMLDEAKERGERHGASSTGIANAGYRHSGEGDVSQTDWRSELADLITRKGDEGDINWGRINRRKFATIGAIMPTRLGTMDRLAVTVDISGSVYRSRLHQFLLELAALIDLMQPASGCLIMWTNTEVEYTDEVFSGAELLDLNVPSGGGTIMCKGAEYLEENGLEADVHLCFTDGELWDDNDWQGCADAGVIMVLDRHPSSWVSEPMRRCGIRHIVACDDQLAA
jgi:predicted metal-dependent peptidase